MPMLSAIGVVPKDTAICGSAVAIAVPSRFCMKKAQATITDTRVGFVAARMRFLYRLAALTATIRDAWQGPAENAKKRQESSPPELFPMLRVLPRGRADGFQHPR